MRSFLLSDGLFVQKKREVPLIRYFHVDYAGISLFNGGGLNGRLKKGETMISVLMPVLVPVRRCHFLMVLLFVLSLAVTHPAFCAPVRLGISSQPLVSLAIIADRQGFLAREGVQATVRHYPSGKHAMEALLAGEVDIATVAETPVVFSSFKRDDYSIFATIGSFSNEQRIVANRKSGITSPADLRGKRVATQQGSAVHFFLHLFLLKQKLSEKDVVLSYLKADELPKALARREIDAFSMREPFVSEARRLLGKDAVVFDSPGLYVMSFHMVAMKAYIKAHPELIARTVRSLIRAEELYRADYGRAVKTVAEELKIPERELSVHLGEMDLRVSLDQSVLMGLEDEARWALNMNLVPGRKMPNYLRYLYLDALQQVRPASITVIR